ncbi:flagellar hook-associated protein FlgK [Geodermatophilus sp. TF02-6]|uniref:flagellar hook-associated protein FlgK n=1 Tax=Geodermatophilus sp. TF02-6 TaxID=2250575 RepID=UPI000DEA3434|nr:flagellar hook-associated protein FlgK [Geodermatophilus sp. TF02-6]RBY79611.1 flagellar hook-associated protein FlgK [Geodermatophilus sp. TF02-6]
MSTFSALNTASTALWAAQRGLDVTGQNVANVNTEGYSRQRVELRATGGTAVPAIHSVSSAVGSGVDADRVTRIRDVFLERRAQTETARTAALTVASDVLGQVETALREPGESGLQAVLAEVWNGFSALSNDSTETGARRQVLERLDTLAAGMRTTRATLDEQWTQTHDDLQALVAEVNATASSVAELNAAIRTATRAGLSTNELSDRRDALVVRLAGQVGGTAVSAADGMVDVVVGGSALVSGGDTLRLELAGGADPDAVAAGDLPRVVTAPGGTALAVGGSAGGQLGVLTTILPTYRGKLDQLARDLVQDLNAVQAAGFDATGAPGGVLMDDGTGNPALVTAATITLRATDPAQLAADANAPAGAGGAVSADGRNADAFSRLGLASDGVDATYRAMVVALGVESSVAARDLQVQTVISTQVDAARESVSGVNLDEEMTSMLSFQHAYSAAARMVTAIDEALDTLISRTGLVGR